MRSTLVIYVFVLLLYSCYHKQNEDVPLMNEQEVKEHMMNANRIFVQQQAEEIKEFINRHRWKMQQSGTGLHYEIYKNGSGLLPESNSIVSIAYSLYLLDGTFCYKVDSAKPLTFVLGKGQQPRGLEEGILLMNQGSKTKLVVPSHLAYGSIGDENKIPGNSALLYDVTLLKIKNARQ